jgi:ribosomal protein L6P/L9E
MNTKEYPEILLVRMTRAQKVFIRKFSKKHKMSEAGVFRGLLQNMMEGKLVEHIKNLSI